MEDKAMTKVKDLTPASKQVNVLVKVVSLSEEREITSKFGEARKLVEATVGDETGTVLLTLWNDQIGSVHKDETLLIDNGYVTLVRGHIRLNVGKYGTMAKSEQMIENVNTALDVSAVEYEREPRYRSGGYSGERRERSGGGDRQFEFGTFSGNRSGGGGGRGVFRNLDVEQVDLRLLEVPELRSFRLVLFVPHPRELLVVVVGHRRHRLNAR